ncbi:hypothetical protein L8O96_12955, partial [Enterobacter kobei]|nr:hypothetical protein [Enterobacter kobei]
KVSCWLIRLLILGSGYNTMISHLGLIRTFPKESLKKELAQGMLVPCFPHQEEWWLDLTAIFRKREYQPWRVQYVLDGVLNCLRQQIAQAAQGRPEQGD